MTRLLTPESHCESRGPQRFSSAKTRGPIRVTSPALADFLISASIDPQVVWLAPSDPVSVRHEGETVTHRPDVLVGRRDGEFVTDIRSRSEARKALYIAIGNAVALAGNRYEVRQCANLAMISRARQIWRCRDIEVTASEQVRVLDHLNRVGTASVREVEDVLSSAPDPRGIVYALIAWDVLEVDILLALTGDTPVRRRRPPQTHGGSMHELTLRAATAGMRGNA